MSNPTIGEFKLPENPEQPKNNNNIKWIAGAIVVGLGFFGYVVQTENNSQPTSSSVQQTTPAPVSKPKPAPAINYEDVYLKVVRDNYPNASFASDGDLLDLGYEACSVFDEGVTLDEYAAFFAIEFAYDEDAQLLAAVVGGAAVGSLCQEHSWMFD